MFCQKIEITEINSRGGGKSTETSNCEVTEKLSRGIFIR